ncbi:MAG: substrate-binding domain-containing protein [Anaerolineales bacterium]|nr:substrate-binding domain-containing protein [Anaerolineales bacterium]
MIKRFRTLFPVLFLIILVLGACTQAEPTQAPEPTAVVKVEPTDVVEPEVEEAEPVEEVKPVEEAEPVEEAAGSENLILATTTSTENSGLLAAILPDFESKYNVKVDVIAVGTGQALQLGRDGNADVLLVHARAQEDAFMDDGDGSRREDVMYNDFVILGPADDPAGIMGKGQAKKAFEMIAGAEAPFVSRGDDSGTHTKEKAIWAEAGIEPAGDWYISAGQGMGAVLTMADEQQAYTLSDRATYLARTLEGIDLEIMVEGDPILFNPYGVMAVNPDKGDHIKADMANTFIDWLVSLETQQLISEFGVADFGSPLFTPDSNAWREAYGSGEEAGAPAEGDVALAITGDIAAEVGWTEAEVLAMETIDATSINKDGEEKIYTGVLIKNLLDIAGLNDTATTLVFVADDGYTAEVALEEVLACEDCIVSFRNQGGFSTVLPDFPGSVQVKGVIEIQVK